MKPLESLIIFSRKNFGCDVYLTHIVYTVNQSNVCIWSQPRHFSWNMYPKKNKYSLCVCVIGAWVYGCAIQLSHFASSFAPLAYVCMFIQHTHWLGSQFQPYWWFCKTCNETSCGSHVKGCGSSQNSLPLSFHFSFFILVSCFWSSVNHVLRSYFWNCITVYCFVCILFIAALAFMAVGGSLRWLKLSSK